MNDCLPSPPGRGARRRTLASLLVLLAAAAPLHPAQLTLKTSGGATTAPAVTVAEDRVELGLDQAVEIALAQNLGIVLQRYTRQQSALGIYQSLGIYDLLATADLTASDNRTPVVNRFQSSRSNTKAFNFNVSQLVPTGGTLTLAANNNRSEQLFTVASDQTLNPAFNAGLTFSFTQPLLRNFGRFQVEHALRVARVTSAVSRQEFERQVTLTLQQVSNAYWNLVEARAQLGVAEESLGLAKELHQRNKIQVEVGTKAPLELVQSEAQIATNEENIIGAAAAVANAADALRQLLHLPDALWDKEIRPLTEPQTEHLQLRLEDSIHQAFEHRPDLKSQQLNLERFKLDAEFFKGQTKPQLDVAVSYGANGVGRDISDALTQTEKRDFPSWTGRLHLSIPLQNRAARAQNILAQIDLEHARTQLEQLKTQVITEVRTAARGVDTAAKQIDAAKASRQFQDKNLEAERKKYENGMSTSFEITRIQSDLTLAKSREVSAIVQYRRALTEYYRATGQLFAQVGIQLEDDEPAVDRFGFKAGGIDAYRPEKGHGER